MGYVLKSYEYTGPRRPLTNGSGAYDYPLRYVLENQESGDTITAKQDIAVPAHITNGDTDSYVLYHLTNYIDKIYNTNHDSGCGCGK